MELTIRQVGYGHWRVSATLRGKKLHIITTDSEAIDLIKSKKWGYKTAIKSFIRKIRTECTHI